LIVGPTQSLAFVAADDDVCDVVAGGALAGNATNAQPRARAEFGPCEREASVEHAR
jgi:hypothetical protein